MSDEETFRKAAGLKYGDRPFYWRTRFEPLPDITTFELALDVKHVNASQIVSERECEQMGTALRHRVGENGRRMDEIWRDLCLLST